MTLKYLGVYEQAEGNWSAYAPDLLPACEGSGATLDEVRQAMREAVGKHIERLRGTGAAIPEPLAQVGTVEVALALA